MQRDQGVACGQRLNTGELGLWQQANQGIDHDITDVMNRVRRNPFAQQIGIPIRRWGKQQLRRLVGQQAIDLLRHGAVKRPQSRLDMADRNEQLDADQRRRHRGIDIAINKDQVRALCLYYLFKTHHDLGRLYSMRPRPNPETDIGLGQTELLKKHI